MIRIAGNSSVCTWMFEFEYLGTNLWNLNGFGARMWHGIRNTVFSGNLEVHLKWPPAIQIPIHFKHF